MAINIEVKHRLKELEDRISALQKQVDQLSLIQVAPKLVEVTKELEKKQSKVRLCPHCGEKPGYFFHVKYCAGKKNKNDADRNRDPGSP